MLLETRTEHSTGKFSFHPNGIHSDQTPLGDSSNSHKDLTLQTSPLCIPVRSSASSQVTLGTVWCQYINKQTLLLTGTRPCSLPGVLSSSCSCCNWALRGSCTEVSQGEILQMKIIDVYATRTDTEWAMIIHLINPPSAVVATALSSTAEWGSLWHVGASAGRAGLLLTLHWAIPGAGHIIHVTAPLSYKYS